VSGAYRTNARDWIFFSSMSQQPLLGQRLLIIEVLRSHSETQYSVGLFLVEWSDRRKDFYFTAHNPHNRRHPCTRRDSYPQCQQASGRSNMPYRLRHRWDWQEIRNTWGTERCTHSLPLEASVCRFCVSFSSYWRLLSAALYCVGNASLLYSQHLFQSHCQCCMCLRLMLTLCCRTRMFNSPSTKALR